MSDAQEALPNPNPTGHELEPEQSVPIDPEDLARHYEQDDVDVTSLARFAVAILAGAVIASGVLFVLMNAWAARPLPLRPQLSPADTTPIAVPGPGLDAVPEFRLFETLQRENERLTTYGWTDEAAGTARIPIDEAMRLMVERGMAAREADAPDFRLHPSFRLDASGGLEPAGNNRFGEVEAGEGADQSGSAEGGSVEDEGSESPTKGSTETGAPETGSGADSDTGNETDSKSGGEPGDNAGGDLPSGEGDQDDEGGAPGTIDPGEEDAAGEEPGGAQSGGNAEGSGTSGGGDQDDEEGAPGTIDPGDEDADGEEPGGAQSGS